MKPRLPVNRTAIYVVLRKSSGNDATVLDSFASFEECTNRCNAYAQSCADHNIVGFTFSPQQSYFYDI